MTTQTIERPAQRTCALCPYFQSFDEPNGRGWCHAFDQMARQHHERTGACDTEIEALDSETQQQLAAHAPEPQAVSSARDDAASYQLQISQETETEFERGYNQGEQDAAAGLHSMYCVPSDECSSGYLKGYSSVLNAGTQLKQVSAPQEWSISYDSKWHCYRAWLGDRYVGSATTYQEAERKAQKYIATDEITKRQNAAVMRAYT